MAYTHIGDAMNTCSRIEGLTKELGEAVLVSESTARLAGAIDGINLHAMPRAFVKGKEETLQVYAVRRASAHVAPAAAPWE